ncbi:MAG: UvrD-helicase domain-containing protein [Raineya sp.]|nr:UvrD-helicase domain-containing protein [Raineya sp.]
MNLTDEQKDIISFDENMKISALAGSGKTSTLIEFAKSRVKSTFLYLAFNRSVKDEAIEKFSKKGVENVRIETAHSLAYRAVAIPYKYDVKNYKTADILEIPESLEKFKAEDRLDNFIFCKHIMKYLSIYCNSSAVKVTDINYLESCTSEQSKAFVTENYEYLEMAVKKILKKMDHGDIAVTHDFYLKKYQLLSPELDYDYIFFDEGQDASPSMLDIFLRQESKKIIVGDTHQQIYGWRGAINSLEQVDFEEFFLSNSFRFSQDIADLANSVLSWKSNLGEGFSKTKITGLGEYFPEKEMEGRAILSRTNIKLLAKAINFVSRNPKTKIYFEGNISSYTYADSGSSVYDVLNLYLQKREYIKDKLIKQFKSISELEEYIKKSEDNELGVLLELVRTYRHELPRLINAIKEQQAPTKEQASMVFSTIHKAKGMEYDEVELLEGFLTKTSFTKFLEDDKKDSEAFSKIIEEINILYVGITRARQKIKLPLEILLSGSSSPQIILT